MPLNNPVAGVEIKTGQYGGNDGVNRAIAHGLTRTPKIVLIYDGDGQKAICSILGADPAVYWTGDHTLAPQKLAVTAATSTNFYVGNATNYFASANGNTKGYHWVAIA